MRRASPYAIFVDAFKSAGEEGLSGYLSRNKGELAEHATTNVIYGLLSNPRGGGPVSLVGASAGGVIDGLLFKPMFDGAAHVIGKGLALADRNQPK